MLLTAIIAVITGAFAAWGIISVNNVKVSRAEKDIIENKAEIRRLDQEKADKETVTLIFKAIDEIKLDIKEIKDGKDK